MEQELIELINKNLKSDAVYLAKSKYGLSLEDATRRVDELASANKKKNKTNLSGEVKPLFWVLGLVLLIMGSIFVYQKFTGLDSEQPKDQIEFELTLSKLKSEANFRNQNELSRENADADLQRLIQDGKTINGWIGEIVSVEKSMFNGNILRVASKNIETGNITNYMLVNIDDNILNGLIQHQKVVFHGVIDGSDQTTFEGLVNYVISNNIVKVNATSVEVIK